jgi:inhibitor of cysteine peptidase
MKEFRRLLGSSGLALALIVGLVACAAPEAEPDATTVPTSEPIETPAPSPTQADDLGHSEPVPGTAQVDSVDLVIMESFPVQVSAVVSGNLPDGCTNIDDIEVDIVDSRFEVLFTTVRPSDAVCTQALVPFEETIPLDVEGLLAGEYTVNVNGVMATFTLDADNLPPAS